MTRVERTERDQSMMAAAARRAPVRARANDGRPIAGTLTHWPMRGVSTGRAGARARVRTLTTGAFISVDPATVELLDGPAVTITPDPAIL